MSRWVWPIAGMIVLAIVVLAGRAIMSSDPASTPTSEPTSIPLATTVPVTPNATPPSATPATPMSTPVLIDEATLQNANVNELGVVPVLMYHAITLEPTDDMWARQIDDFRGDLQWLYDHDFHLVSIRDLLENTIDVPLGKHPVALTFDDASSLQFQFMQDKQVNLVPTPDSAVGVMEAFFAEHPDFGHTAHFGLVPNNCFSRMGGEFNTWKEYCGPKLQWLADHGYEVGNHTWTHENLYLHSDMVPEQVGRTARFIDEHVTGPSNMSTLLTLPFGEEPEIGTDGSSYLHNGVWWQGEEWVLQGMMLVSGGPMYSPSSSWWDPMAISRINTNPAWLDKWFGIFERGEVTLYTSDGNPDTVTIPDPLPKFLQNELDEDLIAKSGKTLITYAPPGFGPLTGLPQLAPGVDVAVSEQDVRLRAGPSTEAEIVVELDRRAPLTIVDGPMDAEGFVWWEVEMNDRTTGWVADAFLAGPPES